jgi:3-hydroxyisobutyrate dehydrogenase
MASRTIGFIGAGRIGRPMMRGLLSAGYAVQVHDKFKSAAESTIEAGATWAATPAAAATGADVVIVCLARPEHVMQSMLGDQGAADAMAAGATWVNTSTTDYHSTMQIADHLDKRGVFSLECPVSNLSHMGVDFGNSSIYCAGDRAGYDAVRDILETISRVSFFTGAIGTAQTVKLLTNHMFYGSVSICGDCFALSQDAGIPCQWMWQYMKGTPAHSVAAAQFIPMLLDGSYDTSCSLEIGVKDMKLTVALADELGVALPLGRVVGARYALAGEVYYQSHNHMKIVKLTEDANDIKIRIPDFAAPSRYGIDDAYVMGDEMVSDSLGRLTPKLPDHYEAPAFNPTPDQRRLVDTLIGFMARTNATLTDEAFDLGRAVGLDPTMIEKMIIWSVGTNWVVENRTSYLPDDTVLPRMASAVRALHLPYLHKVMAVVDGTKPAGEPNTPR